MTDYATEQQAAALWRIIERKMDAKLTALLKVQSGIVPGEAYGSVIFDAAGRAVWGGAGASGGALAFTWHRMTGQSFTSGAAEAPIEYTGTMYDPNAYVTFSPWTFTAPATGVYHYDLFLLFSSAAWTAGNNLRLFQNKDSALPGADDYRQIRYVPIQASFTNAVDINASGTITMNAGDTLGFLCFHNRSGGSISTAGGMCSIAQIG